MKRTNSISLKQSTNPNPQNYKTNPIKTNEHSLDQIISHHNYKTEEVLHNIQPKDIILQRRQSNILGSSYKMSNSIKQSIVKLATGKKIQNGLTTSKITIAILEKVREINNNFVCQVCVCQYSVEYKHVIDGCKHAFCVSCLQHYIQYKISRFQQITCPEQNCPQLISIQSQIYKKLPQNQKQKHSKIRAFYLAQKTNSRLCPDQKCIDGIIYIQNQSNPKCNKCNKIYCPKCYFPDHEGPCQKNQVEFFQNNFKFRQCSSCKAVVQKNQGCNHITCRCKYQFCYLCGGAWNQGNHRCNISPQQLQRLQAQRIQQLQRQYREQEQLQSTCQYKCKCVLKIIWKIILTPLFIAMIFIALAAAIIGCGVTFALVVLFGFFVYSIQMICKQRSLVLKVLQIIFCPVLGLGGIVHAFCQFFPRVFIPMIDYPYQWLEYRKRCFYDW